MNSKPVSTDATGAFNLTGFYTCPSPSSNVYIVATGGNPGLAGNQNNPALALMVALGHCGDLTSSTFVSINEVTTVAAVYALAPYMHSYASVNSGAVDSDFTVARELADSSSGETPGTAATGLDVPATKLRTLANVVASCVNSNGTNGVCRQMFALSTYSDGPAPTDTIAALLEIAKNPTQNVA
ncbi:MAG: hypothetical protein ABI142_08165, partial [Bryocella sp.]